MNVAFVCGLALAPTPAAAQWWTAEPADFEDCAERAKASRATGESTLSRLSDCEAKFAGRRKPGGGYTYHDFMQNRSFDIAGPNPTAAEQKAIDLQYTEYLDGHRQSIIRAAFAEKQRQQQQASLEINKPAVATASPVGKAAAVMLPRPRPKQPKCAPDPLSCGWSKLSAGIKDIGKALFGAPAKTKRG